MKDLQKNWMFIFNVVFGVILLFVCMLSIILLFKVNYSFSIFVLVGMISLSFPLSLLMLVKSKHINPIGLITLVITIIIMLFVTEILLRIFLKDDASTGYAKTARYHHNYIPSSTIFHKLHPDDGGHTVKSVINSLAIRGPEIPPKKANEKRILLVGDSFIEAVQVPYDSTTASFLGEMVESNLISVLSHGMSSWSPLLELNWLIKTGMNLQPDVVVLFICDNDLSPRYHRGDSVYTAVTNFDDEGYPVSFDVQEDTSNKKPDGVELVKKIIHSTLFNLKISKVSFKGFNRLADMIYEIRYKPLMSPDKVASIMHVPSRQVAEEYYNYYNNNNYANVVVDLLYGQLAIRRPMSEWNVETKRSYELTEKYILLMNQYLAQNNVELVLTTIPLPMDLSLEACGGGLIGGQLARIDSPLAMGGFEESIRILAEDNDISYVDLYNPLLEAEKREEKLLYFPNNRHWTPLGHYYVAKTLNENLDILKDD